MKERCQHMFIGKKYWMGTTIFQLYWWRKPECLEKTTDLPQVIDKLSHNVASSTPAWAGFEPTTLVVIGSDFIDSYKSNYHTIMITTTPISFKASPCESFEQVISIWYLFLIFYIMTRASYIRWDDDDICTRPTCIHRG